MYKIPARKNLHAWLYKYRLENDWNILRPQTYSKVKYKFYKYRTVFQIEQLKDFLHWVFRVKKKKNVTQIKITFI